MCEQDSSTASYFDNITATVKSVVRNIDISAGIGQGIYTEFKLFEVGIGIGMYGNYGTINYSQGVWSTGQELYFGITATLTPWLEFGAAEHYSRDSRNKEEHTSWIGYNDTQDTWTICSFAFYPLFAGVSFSVGFDILTFLEEYDVIWGR